MSQIRNKLIFPQRWFRFALVGGIGFIVDSAVLVVAAHILNLDPVKSRLISFSFAVFVTWLLNREFTFSGHINGTPHARFQHYLVISAIGFAVNFGIYLVLIFLIPISARYPLLALVPSSLIAAAFNYWGYSRFAFLSSTDDM